MRSIILKSRLFCIFLLFVFVFEDHLHAQDLSWSLEECVRYALDHNIGIKQQELQTRVKEEQLSQVRSERFPSLNMGASHDYSFGRALDPSTYEYTENQTVHSDYFNINSSVSIFEGFQKQNRIKKQTFDLKSGLQDLEKLKNDISMNIASAFLNILFNKEILKVASDKLELSRQQVERTKKMVEAGQWVKGKLLETKAQLASDSLQWINANNQLDISYLNLAQLLELDSLSNFRIDTSGIPETLSYDIPPANQVFREAKDILPRIKGAEYEVKSAQKNLEIAEGMKYPSLILKGNYGSRYSSIRERQMGTEISTIPIGYVNGETVYSDQSIPQYESYPFFDQLSDNISGSLSLNLSIPVFNHLRTRTAINTARIGVMNSRYSLKQEEKQLLKDVQMAWTDAQASYKSYYASKQAVEAAKESFRYAQQRYEVGLINNVDFLTVRNQYMQARSEMLQSKYEYIFKTKILDFYRGTPIYLSSN